MRRAALRLRLDRLSLLLGLLLAISSIPHAAWGQTAPPPTAVIEFPPFVTASLRDGLDTTISPCTDFDQYVNGGWRARTPLPTGVSRFSIFEATKESTSQRLRALLDSVRRIAATTSDADARVVGMYYESCVRADSLERSLALASMYGARASDTTRAARCQRLVMKDMPDALGQLFVAAVLSPDTEAQARQMITAIQAAVGRRVDQLPWASAAEKARAVHVLQGMTLKVARPEHPVDHRELKLTLTDVSANQRAILSYLSKYTLLLSGNGRQPVWTTSQYDASAIYQTGVNSIEVPTMMFQYPWFHPTGEPALGYAAVGAIIGHEIMHGVVFETKIDANPEYQKRLGRLVHHYTTLPPIVGAQINGRSTLTENLADLGGLLAAYDAWQHTSRAKAAPVIEGFTPEQRFFLHYARLWRTKATDRYLQLQAGSSHAPGQVRINGVLTNVPAFAKAFGCKAGDKMVRSDTDRVVIW